MYVMFIKLRMRLEPSEFLRICDFKTVWKCFETVILRLHATGVVKFKHV